MNRALLPLILIILSVTGFFMWVNPHVENIKVLKTQMIESDSAMTSLKQLESAKLRLQNAESNFAKADTDKLQKLLPDNIDNIRLLLDIQGIASHYGVSIQDISVADQGQKTTAPSAQAIGPSNKQYGQMALSFSIGMSYENLMLFLKDLEKDLRLVEIKSISFAADNKNPNTYKVSVSINAFWLSAKTSTVK